MMVAPALAIPVEGESGDQRSSQISNPRVRPGMFSHSKICPAWKIRESCPQRFTTTGSAGAVANQRFS